MVQMLFLVTEGIIIISFMDFILSRGGEINESCKMGPIGSFK